MNYTDLVRATARETGYAQAKVKEIIDALVGVTSDTLISGEEVKIAGLGKFEVKDVAGRTGRNPQTGEEIEIAPTRRVAFKVTQSLKDAVKEA